MWLEVFYDRQLKLSTLGYKTPAQFEVDFWDEQAQSVVCSIEACTVTACTLVYVCKRP